MAALLSQPPCVYSPPPCAAYIRQWIGSALYQIMACRLFWTNAGLLSIGPLGTNFSEILIKIQDFSFMKMHLKISFVKWRPSCFNLSVLTTVLFVCSKFYMFQLLSVAMLVCYSTSTNGCRYVLIYYACNMIDVRSMLIGWYSGVSFKWRYWNFHCWKKIL